MNILPKKRWHVRTKENIARVRKDEAEAAEKEKLEQQRIENADREARLNVLKQKSKQTLLDSGIDVQKAQDQPPISEHINLFTDLDHAVISTNKEHDKEIREKKEEYEKKIGYLTYLGQDTNEALKKKNWYEVAPEERFSHSHNVKDTYEKLVLKDADGKPKKKELDVKDGELDWKVKTRLDPINNFKQFCSDNNKKVNVQQLPHKHLEMKKNHFKMSKSKKNKDDKEDKLKKLREIRIKREQQEKYKTEMFLSGLNKTSTAKEDESHKSKVKAKYNSQFNPELARQNYR